MPIDIKGTRIISDAGAIAATSMASTGAVSGTTGTFTGAVSGTSGTFTGALANGTTTVHTPHAVSALALDVTASTVFTKSIAADSTFTASAAGTAGQLLILIITVDGTQRVATFGTNFNSSGTMTIPASKVGCIQCVSDGTAWREVGRSINT